MRRLQLPALQAAVEEIIRAERRALAASEIFDRLPEHLRAAINIRRFSRDLGRTSLLRLGPKWTIDPLTLWRVAASGASPSARRMRNDELRDASARAFDYVTRFGTCKLRFLHAMSAPQVEFVRFRKALSNRLVTKPEFKIVDDKIIRLYR